MLPLSLLEAVRAHDRPEEILEDEDLTVSLPRRLGLTGVIGTQIQRYEAARRSGKDLPADEVISLMRLVLKRPDAQAILADTGRRLAEAHFESGAKGYIGLLRKMPRGLLVRFYRRSARRLLRQIAGNANVEISGRPPVVRITRSPMTALEPVGSGCTLYTAVLEHLAEAYAGTQVAPEHSRCISGGGVFCEWKVAGL